MTTLLVESTSDGIRRCDARCYEAKEPECECACGGRNHGVGRERAILNTAALLAEMREQERKRTRTRRRKHPVDDLIDPPKTFIQPPLLP